MPSQRQSAEERKEGRTVTAELLRALVRGVLDLDSNTSTSFVLLDNVLGLVVDLEAGAVKGKRQ